MTSHSIKTFSAWNTPWKVYCRFYLWPPPGAESVPGAGGLPQDHAPYIGGGCWRHDPTGRHDRGRPPQEPDAPTQTRHHLCKAHVLHTDLLVSNPPLDWKWQRNFTWDVSRKEWFYTWLLKSVEIMSLDWKKKGDLVALKTSKVISCYLLHLFFSECWVTQWQKTVSGSYFSHCRPM